MVTKKKDLLNEFEKLKDKKLLFKETILLN